MEEDIVTGKFLLALSTPFHKIDDYLFLGNRDYDCASLLNNKIQKVVRFCTEDYSTPNTQNELIEYHIFRLGDNPSNNIRPLISQVIPIIRNSIDNKIGVLVQCDAGCSRSASFVIAYIMQKYGLGYEEARNRVQEIRACVYPNEGFAAQLLEIEAEGGLIEDQEENET